MGFDVCHDKPRMREGYEKGVREVAAMVSIDKLQWWLQFIFPDLRGRRKRKEASCFYLKNLINFIKIGPVKI